MGLCSAERDLSGPIDKTSDFSSRQLGRAEIVSNLTSSGRRLSKGESAVQCASMMLRV